MGPAFKVVLVLLDSGVTFHHISEFRVGITLGLQRSLKQMIYGVRKNTKFLFYDRKRHSHIVFIRKTAPAFNIVTSQPNIFLDYGYNNVLCSKKNRQVSRFMIESAIFS